MNEIEIQVGEQVVTDKGLSSERNGTVVDRAALFYIVQLDPDDEIYLPDRHLTVTALVVHPGNLTRRYPLSTLERFRRQAATMYNESIEPGARSERAIDVPADARVSIERTGAWIYARVWVPQSDH
jgi:hypothetical protein